MVSTCSVGDSKNLMVSLQSMDASELLRAQGGGVWYVIGSKSKYDKDMKRCSLRRVALFSRQELALADLREAISCTSFFECLRFSLDTQSTTANTIPFSVKRSIEHEAA